MIALLLAFAVSATPGHLRLGTDASASVAIGCAQEPRVVPNSGTVDGLRREGSAWTARYLPPHSALPRAALLAVFCGEDPALLAIPLWGAGDAEVHAGPHAVVSVRIGDELFGPLRTDAAGVARVPVVVPPGVDFAYQGPRAIDLHVPRTRTVHLAVAKERLAADRARSVSLFAFAVDRAGAPLPGAALQLSATRGTLSAPEAIAPGVYRIGWSFEPGAPGEAQASATIDGDPRPATASLSLVAGEPVTVELRPERESLTAGDGPLRVEAVVRDAAGNLVDGALHATASLGSVRDAAQGQGRHELFAQVPATLGGATEVRIGVAAGSATAEARIALKPAAPAQVLVDAAQPRVLADGRTAVRVHLRALDRFGNEVPDAPAATSSAGKVSKLARAASGWEATFVPPLSHQRGAAIVDVRTGPAAGSARIELDPAVRPFAVALRAGVFSNFHELTAPIAGVVGSLRTDLLGAQLGVQLSLDGLGWSSTGLLATTAGDRQLHTAMNLVFAGAGAEWRMPLSDRAAAWVQAGPVLAFASTETTLSGGDPETARGAEPGAQGGAGAELRLWRGRALLELRWLAVRSFALSNLQGPLSGLCASAGYRVEIF